MATYEEIHQRSLAAPKSARCRSRPRIPRDRPTTFDGFPRRLPFIHLHARRLLNILAALLPIHGWPAEEPTSGSRSRLLLACRGGSMLYFATAFAPRELET